MPDSTFTDDEIDRLLETLDPLHREIMFRENVASARLELGAAIVREARGRRLEVPAATGHRTGRRSRRASLTRGERLAWSGVAAAALASALVLTGALPTEGTHDAELGLTPATAATALDHAATTAMRQPAAYPTASQYEYLKVQEGSTTIAGMEGVDVRVWMSDTAQNWYRADGAGRIRVTASKNGFLDPSDAAIAKGHGLADQILSGFGGDGDSAYPASVNDPRMDLDPAGLPTQPAALLRAIKRLLRATEPGYRPSPASEFAIIADRLLPDSTSPTLRAALYRVIARLPGVRLLGWQADRIGRRGIAVAISRVEASGGSPPQDRLRYELLFDPSTSNPLQTQQVLAAPSSLGASGVRPLPAGTALNYTVYIQRGIVNSIEDLPGGGHQPLAQPARELGSQR